MEALPSSSGSLSVNTPQLSVRTFVRLLYVAEGAAALSPATGHSEPEAALPEVHTRAPNAQSGVTLGQTFLLS